MSLFVKVFHTITQKSISEIGMVESDQMQRVDLYIKVEVELDEDEKPERVAAEICRQIEKLYMVRSAELSSMINRD
ncbi:MAG: hypothetical protein JO182_29495 [Acidobacteriaceae bacterium]|nr:hypothetical protein [Acidobacteriaceae bacterium]MBV9038658.1 hypothetical protein [Acidobacteriaceae bacterium]MBV9308548.1 hypothetical protein [Acidobacteriaceae bacterium]MBV9677002.1 hypothetical protein [Acidobacteriaceae bacterium]